MVEDVLFNELILDNDISIEKISTFISKSNCTTNSLIKRLFRALNNMDDLEQNKDTISNIINIVILVCSTASFSDEEIEINRNRIKKIREKFLSYLKYDEDNTIRLSCNKLDEIVLGKSISVDSVVEIIIHMISINEDIEIIKKMFSINKGCIAYNNCFLFDYVFNKAIDSIENNNFLITYYITLLKIFYSSSIDRDKYNSVLLNKSGNNYYNEIYNIVFGNKRSLNKEEIISKYDKDTTLLTGFINPITCPRCENNGILTIDGAKSYTRDDAISIKKDGPYYRVSIYITDVGGAINPESCLDVQARNLFKNSYLEDKKIELFPIKSTKKMSLNKSSYRGCIILEVILNDSGELIDYCIKNNGIVVSENLNYFDVDKILEGKSPSEFKRNLDELFILSEALREKSKAKEKYWQSKENSKIYKRMYNTRSHMIVGEFSILYNKLVAILAKEKDFPYIYRGQKQSYLPELVSSMDISLDGYSKRIVEGVFLEGYYSSIPVEHNGLHEKIYSQSSSPLRRYTDAYNQFLYHKYYFKDKDFDDSNLELMIKYLNEREFETRLFEEEYNREAMLVKRKRN